jgi:hypothetical protein
MSEAKTLHLTRVAAEERESVRDFVEEILPTDARVSVYLFQPVEVTGLRTESPGALFDVGPVPDAVRSTKRDLLYQCAEAGRTGSFLQSADDCTRRVPQTTEIDKRAYDSYRAYNDRPDARRALISVEAARYGFEPQTPDGPPMGWHIHHLALAPSVHSFTALHTGRIPVLGAVFTLTREAKPAALREYSNLVDYAIFIAEEALEIRATHLFGGGHLGANFAGSALEKLLDDPTCDDAVQLVVKLLFGHHWFFPYDAAAYEVLRRAAGDEGVALLYERHGWSPPRRRNDAPRSDSDLREVVTSDIVTLIRHLSWYRLGKDFRPRPHQVLDAVTRALNTALLLLCGSPADMPVPRSSPAYARRARDRYLGPPNSLVDLNRDESLLAPVFPISGVRQLIRTERARANGGHGITLERFAPSFAVCGPGFTEGHTRTHLKPSGFVESFERGGAPRFSSKRESGVRERTKWLCSYAIARLAESALGERVPVNGAHGDDDS